MELLLEDYCTFVWYLCPPVLCLVAQFHLRSVENIPPESQPTYSPGLTLISSVLYPLIKRAPNVHDGPHSWLLCFISLNFIPLRRRKLLLLLPQSKKRSLIPKKLRIVEFRLSVKARRSGSHPIKRPTSLIQHILEIP